PCDPPSLYPRRAASPYPDHHDDSSRTKSCSPFSAPPLGSRSYSDNLHSNQAPPERTELGLRWGEEEPAAGRPVRRCPRAPTSCFHADCHCSSGLAEPKQ
ncbi:Os06g0564300, partial [Oryza sativa Japonica Group]